MTRRKPVEIVLKGLSGSCANAGYINIHRRSTLPDPIEVEVRISFFLKKTETHYSNAAQTETYDEPAGSPVCFKGSSS